MLFRDIYTYKDGFSSDSTILRFDTEFSLLTDLLTVTFFFGKLKTKLFDLVANESNSLGGISKRIFKTSILSFNLNYNFQIILIAIDFMLNDVVNSDLIIALSVDCECEEKRKYEKENATLHMDLLSR